METVVRQCGELRVIEVADTDYSLADLKGDVYNRSVNPEIPEKVMAKEEREFERQVETEGVYGYVLQRWEPAIDCGWITIDSCYGFVGCYEDQAHYIVDEWVPID
jgi:hypothetical protein